MAAASLTFHRLTDDEFRSVAGGHGSDDALAELRSSQLSKRLILLHWIRSMADDDALALIDSVGRSRPDVVRDVLAQPFVDAWAGIHGTHLESATPPDPHGSAYLSGLAAAVALRAGVEADLRIAVQPGQVVLPGIGLAYGLGTGPARVRCDLDRVTVTGPDDTVTAVLDDPADRPGWCPTRLVDLGPSGQPLVVAVDDLDPYRSQFGMVLHRRLAAAEADRLAVNLADAWELITADYPGYAGTVRECLRSIVPLAAPSGGGSVSGTARRAFGAVAISPQRDGPALALLLIHELQHVKYNAVADLVDLVEPGHTGLYEAPWRADPRPASAVLTGAYAHTGVVDFWRNRRRRTDGDAARLARFEAAYWLEQTSRSLQTLAASDALTELGHRFVDELRGTTDAWRAEPVDPALADGVEDLVTAVSVGWRLRNHRVADSDLDALAEAWHGGMPRPALPAAVTVAGTLSGAAPVKGITAALRRRLGGYADASSVDPIHQGYLSGDPDGAAGEFVAAARDGDDDAWAGLALAWGRTGRSTAARTLRCRPELLRALYGRLGDGHDLEQVAAWLAAGGGGQG